MGKYKMVDGVNVPFTVQDDAEWEARKIADEEAAPARRAEEARTQRRATYQAEADPLFFEEQAGEVAAGTWAAKRAEIKQRFPK